jgi:hypothetical protein
MRLLGIGVREVVGLARHRQRQRDVPGPLLVTGVLAEQLARELRAGGDPALVRTSGEPSGAGALVLVVAGAATPEGERALRDATRALVPVVAVQTKDPAARLPYVLAENVVWCRPGSGFPVEEIADRLAAALGEQGASLAASLPVLREAVMRRSAVDGALSAASLAALGAGAGSRLPVLALTQARMLSDFEIAEGGDDGGDGRNAPQDLAVPLGAALATGVAARTLVRRLPVRWRLLDGLVAAGATLALGAVFRRLPRP